MLGHRWRLMDDIHCSIRTLAGDGNAVVAGIKRYGGLHVFFRHSPATFMVAKRCGIRIVQEILRHRDIRTTLRYAHVVDKTKREMYEQYLAL